MDPASDRLLAMLRHPSRIGGGRGKTSPVFAWMTKRRREIERALDAGPPNWKAMAEAMASEGITDGTGRPPTGERCRKTWWAVRKAAEAATAPETAPATRPVKPKLTREERIAREMAALQRQYEAGKLPGYPKPLGFQPKPVPEPVGEFYPPAPPPDLPPKDIDPVARLKAEWATERAPMPMPKPMAPLHEADQRWAAAEAEQDRQARERAAKLAAEVFSSSRTQPIVEPQPEMKPGGLLARIKARITR